MLREILIAFDVREMWLDTDKFRDEQGRNTFLLKQDVRQNKNRVYFCKVRCM